MLAQYDTPDAILAHPADEFVERFIGEDRALRRLALRRVGDVELEPARRTAAGPATSVGRDDHGPERGLADARDRRATACSSSATTASRSACSRSTQRRRSSCAVTAAGPRHPRLRHRAARACTGDHLFCWDWVQRALGRHARAARSSQHVELTLIAVAIGFVLAFGLALLAHRVRALEQPIGDRRRR